MRFIKKQDRKNYNVEINFCRLMLDTKLINKLMNEKMCKWDKCTFWIK